MPSHYLVTGATGFVGGHVAEACAKRGIKTSTIARPGSDTALLEQLGTTIHRGDISDGKLVRQALEGVDVVVHCAAKVGDWGAVDDYRKTNVDAFRGLLDACVGRPLHRFVHISTLGVYPAQDHHGTDENDPVEPDHPDAYPRTKVEAEQLVLQFYREKRIPIVVLRPGFIYGPRDRYVLTRIIDSLRNGEFRYLGGGDRALNTIYVANLVDAVFLAVDHPGAVGEVYNLTDGEFVSKRRFIEAVAGGLGLEKPTRSVPLWLARPLARFLERRARRLGATEPPRLTQARLKFLGLNLDYSIEKARRELAYGPRVGFDEGIKETMAWYREKA
jgi:nucleoside-diphosphate-sugar epimerase